MLTTGTSFDYYLNDYSHYLCKIIYQSGPSGGTFKWTARPGQVTIYVQIEKSQAITQTVTTLKRALAWLDDQKTTDPDVQNYNWTVSLGGGIYSYESGDYASDQSDWDRGLHLLPAWN